MRSSEPRDHDPACVDRRGHTPQRHGPRGRGCGLTFIFGFGNVWTLALRLGVPAWVAPLVAPAVDLSILGLLLGTPPPRAPRRDTGQLGPARRLLIFSSLVTLALNIADPLIAGEIGKAAFDSVGPLFLIGWAEVGPGLLQAIGTVDRRPIDVSRTIVSGNDRAGVDAVKARDGAMENGQTTANERTTTSNSDDATGPNTQSGGGDLLERARLEGARHWAARQRPISAETLRRNLRIGAARSRMLVSIVRAERLASQDTPLTVVDQSELG